MALSSLFIGGVVFLVTYSLILIWYQRKLIDKYREHSKDMLKEFIKASNDYKELVMSLNNKK